MWGEPSEIPAEVKDLINEETSALLEEISWEKLSRYRHASQTLTVPFACRAEWKMAFQLPNHLWKEGYTEDAIKLHYLMIQMIAALMPMVVRLGEDDEEGQAEEQQGSVTRMVQSRLRRFFYRRLEEPVGGSSGRSRQGAEGTNQGGAGGIQDSTSQASGSHRPPEGRPPNLDAAQHGQSGRQAGSRADACPS
jgi:hypothetical protein